MRCGAVETLALLRAIVCGHGYIIFQACDRCVLNELNSVFPFEILMDFIF